MPRSSRDLIFRKILAEFLRKILWRFLEEKIVWKFWSKLFLLKIFKRSSNNFFLKSFCDLWKIFSSNLFEIVVRSSINIFLRSTQDLLVFGLIFNFEKKIKNFVNQMVKNGKKIFWRSSYKIFWQSSYKSSKNLFEILWRSQKDFYRRSSEDLKENS